MKEEEWSQAKFLLEEQDRMWVSTYDLVWAIY